MSWEKELEVTLMACEQTRARIMDAYDRFEPILDAKAEIKLTIDVETQETLLQHLSKAFPKDAFIAEEDSPTLTQIKGQPCDSGRTWIVDPIDGTRGFARKNGEFSVMVGLVADDRVVLGVVMEPIRQRLTYATRGGGCWKRDGQDGPLPCHVGEATTFFESSIVVSHLKQGSTNARLIQRLATKRVLETYSAGIKLAIVARGEADMYFNYYAGFHDWDVCAGHILVEEAGGKVTVLSGQPIIYGGQQKLERDGFLASNGHLHAAALGQLR